LSFDTSVDLGDGLVVADEDRVDWNGTSFALAFDGSEAGLVFDDEDVVRFDGANWSLEFDVSMVAADWGAEDQDRSLGPGVQ